eukprot:3066714-Karenia_brevis.AAC.1
MAWLAYLAYSAYFGGDGSVGGLATSVAWNVPREPWTLFPGGHVSMPAEEYLDDVSGLFFF